MNRGALPRNLDRRSRRLPRAWRAWLAALAVLSALCALLAGCELSSGGGTDVGNPEFARVTGSLRHGDGSPAADILLHLRARDHWASPDSGTQVPLAAAAETSADKRTDSQGFFAFDSVPKGTYRIEGTDGGGLGILIEVDVDGKAARIALAPAFLGATGSIAGKINYLGVIPRVYPKITVAAYGTDRATFTTNDGSYILSDLPEGSYKLHISMAGDSLSAEVPEVHVTAGQTAQAGTVDLGP